MFTLNKLMSSETTIEKVKAGFVALEEKVVKSMHDLTHSDKPQNLADSLKDSKDDLVQNITD